jgi:hypothetical protein
MSDDTHFKDMSETFRKIIENFLNASKTQIDKRPEATFRKDGSFYFIPFGERGIFAILYDLLNIELCGRGTDLFLDAGSGIGNVTTVAYFMNLAKSCHGLEYDKRYVGFSKKFMSHKEHYFKHGTVRGTREIKYIHGDILTFDKYSEYDIIYYFCPFSSIDLELLFEEIVEDQMKVGAYLIPLNKQGWKISDDDRFEKVTGIRGSVFKKVSDGRRVKRHIPRNKLKCLAEKWQHRYPNLIEIIEN